MEDDPSRGRDTLTAMIVLTGVAGAGKSTVGAIVAGRLGVPFFDADDFHDPSSIDAMRAGIALDDRRRQPWLHRLNDLLRAHQASGVVLACSALKRSHRDVLGDGLDHVLFVQLAVSEDVLATRLNSRAGHYAGVELLPSQLATLEPGDDLVAVDGELPPEAVADEVLLAARRSDDL
jgi:gluconokinase